MAELGAMDQAAGLRRLFGNRSARTVSLVHVRRHDAAAVTLARTANALAAHGQTVVVVDEHRGPNSVTAMTGQTVRHDLFDAFIGECDLSDVFLTVTPKIKVVPAARAAREFGGGEVDIEARMAACMAELGVKAGFVLLDAQLRQGDLSMLAKATDHLAIVTRPVGQGITDTYALIKRQGVHGGRKMFHLVLEGVGDSLIEAGEARTIVQNLRTTAHKHLQAELNHLGSIDDESADDLADGLLTRLPGSESRHAKSGNVVRLRGMFGPSGLFESVV